MLIQNIIIEKYIKHIKIKDEYIKIEIIVFSIFKYSPKIPDEPFNPSKFHFIHYHNVHFSQQKTFHLLKWFPENINGDPKYSHKIHFTQR